MLIISWDHLWLGSLLRKLWFCVLYLKVLLCLNKLRLFSICLVFEDWIVTLRVNMTGVHMFWRVEIVQLLKLVLIIRWLVLSIPVRLALKQDLTRWQSLNSRWQSCLASLDIALLLEGLHKLILGIYADSLVDFLFDLLMLASGLDLIPVGRLVGHIGNPLWFLVWLPIIIRVKHVCVVDWQPPRLLLIQVCNLVFI